MARTSAGVFSGLGGSIVIKTGITPSPEQIRSQLYKVAGELEDTLKPILASREIAKDDIQAHFDSGYGPDGIQWHALNRDYKRQKEAAGLSGEKLIRTGELEKATQRNEAYVVTPHGLWFNWDAMPKIENAESESGEGNLGILMQRGSATTIKVTTGRGETVTSVESGKGRGMSLPARPFVGLSNYMEGALVEVFDVWFDESIKVVVHPKTGVMQRFEGNKFGKAFRFG